MKILLLIGCSLILSWNIVWAESTYHNPFGAGADKIFYKTINYQQGQNVWDAHATSLRNGEHPLQTTNLYGITPNVFGASPKIFLPTIGTTEELVATAKLIALATSLTTTVNTSGIAMLLPNGTAAFLTGTAGLATGGLAAAGLMSLATAVGTASTGTAIASLSGAAAMSSALAWLGGGAVSAGGLGMAGGVAVLTGGAALVMLGTSAAVMYFFHSGDEKIEQQRIEKLLASVKHDL